MALSPRQLAAAAHAAGWRGRGLVEIVAIAMAESGGNPNALNPTGEHSVGLTQINMDAHGSRFGSEAQLRDPVNNFRAALELSGGSNFTPWSVHRSNPYSPSAGASDRHISTAQAAAADFGGVAVPRGSGGGGGGGSQGGGGGGGGGFDFTPFDAEAQRIDAESAQAAREHQQRVLEYMNTLIRGRQNRGPRPVRSSVTFDRSAFDPEPMQNRVREIQTNLDLTPSVQRRSPRSGDPVEDRAARLLGGMDSMLRRQNRR